MFEKFVESQISAIIPAFTDDGLEDKNQISGWRSGMVFKRNNIVKGYASMWPREVFDAKPRHGNGVLHNLNS